MVGPYWKKLCPLSRVRPSACGLGPYSRPRTQFFPIRTSRPVNNIYFFLEQVDEDVLLLVFSCTVLTSSRSVGLCYSGSSRSCAEGKPYFYDITCIGSCDYPGFSPFILIEELEQSGYETVSHNIKSPPAKTTHLFVSVCISGQKAETRARDRR